MSRPLPDTRPIRPWLRRALREWNPREDHWRPVTEYYLAFSAEVDHIVNGSRPPVLCCPPDVLDDIGYLLHHDLSLAVLGHTYDFPHMVTPRLLTIHRRLLRVIMHLDAEAVRAAG